MRAVELVIRLLADMQEELSDYFPLGIREQSEVVGEVMGFCKAEGHAKIVSPLQVSYEVGW